MLSQVVRASRRAAPPTRSAIRARARRYQHIPRRVLSTSASESTSSSPSPENDLVPDSIEEDLHAPVLETLQNADPMPSSSTLPRRSRATRTAFIRTWKPVNNIVDAFTMIRAIERKFGRVLDAHFPKDYEVPVHYQCMSWIIFANPKSLQRIPQNGLDFSIPTSGVKTEAFDLGMDDLERVTKARDYEQGFEFIPADPEGKQPVIGGRIIRAEEDYHDETVDRRLFQGTSKYVMRSWLQWGGFAKLTPIETTEAIRPEQLFDPKYEAEIDLIRMRASMQVAAFATRMSNPAVRLPTRATKDGKPSLGQAVFGGLLEGKNNEATTFPEPSDIFIDDLPSTSAAENAAEDKTSTSTLPSSEPELEPSTPPPPPEPREPTPEEVTAKEALGRQLEVARQLRERVSPPARRKQAKPPMRAPRPRSTMTAQKKPLELEFFQAEKVDEEVSKEAEKKPGVLGKLFGFLRR
ncbi:hypothetical protein CPB84DRAFT_1820953 [Gymnopilus junonius]|uniref:Uncharacterized protein n=1 Tax=Gymnopilus junonius TaxID=109634 RepID=A0A9P5P0V6_GYMJU|nr:hypothetical protein CPB84DRAFT_1820953 [Gymnopilus junonius]